MWPPFLNKLARSNPNQNQVNTAVRRAIQDNSRFRQQLRQALTAGGREALQTIFSHPVIRISGAMVEAWLRES
jgi:hypothetical protein